jgi:uncharacterized protein (TIGR02145 family)
MNYLNKSIILSFLISINILQAQVGIGTVSPASSSLLDIESTTKGLLIPRMTQAERLLIVTAANGLLVYQTDVVPGFYYYDSTITDWQLLSNNYQSVKGLNTSLNLNGTYLDLTDGDGIVTADLSSLKELPTPTAAGAMNYWDGTAWIELPPTQNDGAELQMLSGVPTWVGGTPPPPSVTSVTGRIWMDRNLGATQVATSSTDAASYGDLYQWGRGTDGHEKRTSGTTTTLATSDTPGHGDFITTWTSPVDWRSPQNDNLWQGVNGINNPCPSGYRLPTQAEWETERLSWDTNLTAVAAAFASPLKISLAGNRDGGPSASIGNAGAHGVYYSSTVGGTGGHFIRIRDYPSNDVTNIYAADRRSGLSVRCIKD